MVYLSFGDEVDLLIRVSEERIQKLDVVNKIVLDILKILGVLYINFCIFELFVIFDCVVDVHFIKVRLVALLQKVILALGYIAYLYRPNLYL